MPKEVFIGIDGGGTRTRVCLADRQGKVLGQGEGSASLVDPEAPSKAALLVDTIVRRVMNEHNIARPATAMWAALAGAGRLETQRRVRDELREISGDLVKKIGVGTDVDAAVEDAFQGSPGIVLIAGTGSIAFALDQEGNRLTVGGWGSQLGDEGSGYAIGRDGLSALLWAADGRGPETALTGLLGELDLEAPQELVNWVARATKRDIAALAPIVVRYADEGDQEAQRVVDKATTDLRKHLEALVSRMGTRGVREVALVGGLIVPGRAMRTRVEWIIGELELTVLQREVLPDRGAAGLARAMADAQAG